MHFCGEKHKRKRVYYSSVVRNGTNKLLLIKVCIYIHIKFKPEDDDDDDSDDDEDDNEQ